MYTLENCKNDCVQCINVFILDPDITSRSRSVQIRISITTFFANTSSDLLEDNNLSFSHLRWNWETLKTIAVLTRMAGLLACVRCWPAWLRCHRSPVGDPCTNAQSIMNKRIKNADIPTHKKSKLPALCIAKQAQKKRDFGKHCYWWRSKKIRDP